MVEHVEISTDTPLFVASCPMANGGKGGQLLQSDETVANPYYGSMMLRCGSIDSEVE
jgi:Cu(I)/Ag(I) efflux system membrane fusion protein